jgi:hypothetical protein
MGCVLGKDKLDSSSDCIVDIHNSKEAIALSDESLYNQLRTNFNIILQFN